MFNKINNLLKLQLLLTVSFFFIFSNFITILTWPEVLTLPKKIIYLDETIKDFIIISAFIILFYSKRYSVRFLSHLLIIFFVLCYFVQCKSIEITGSFIHVVALENAEHIDFFDVGELARSGLIWLSLLLVFFLIEHRFIHSYSKLVYRIPFFFLLLLTAIVINNDHKYLSKEVIKERKAFYRLKEVGFPHSSPMLEMGETLISYSRYWKKQNIISRIRHNVEIPEEAARFAAKYYKDWGILNKSYPLMREKIYIADLPFENMNNNQQLNVIVFFAEGMSARLIQPYSDDFPNISPHFSRFSHEAMRVDNYNNHTWATYRGIGGSLCSMHPIGRLIKETDYYCLPHILQEEGYDTHFLISQKAQKTGLDEIFNKSGIEHIDDYYTLSSLLQREDDTEVLTDLELINALILRLKNYESKGNDEKDPFFLGLYNFQTHIGVRVKTDKDNLPYIHPELGENYVLNTFHNFDRVFGLFWDYFKESTLYSNTIVIVTTDHATYPAKDYTNLTNYHIWADEIPLMIYHPSMELPDTFDAKNASSINLAPSLLHLLGVENRANPFSGFSIFDDSANIPRAMAGDIELFWFHNIYNNWIRIIEETKADGHNSEGIEQFSYIQFCHFLERNNRLWLDQKSQ